MQSNGNPRHMAAVARALVIIGTGLGVGLVTAHVADQSLAAATQDGQAEAEPQAPPTPEPVVVKVVRNKVVTPEPVIVYRTVRPQGTTTWGGLGSGGTGTSTSASTGGSAPAPAAPAPRFTPAPPPAPAPAAKPDAVSRSS